MNGFITALCSNAKSESIPEEYDFFQQFNMRMGHRVERPFGRC
ncbi:hypothetical protein Pgin01_00140 [Porphyromonas gingivalis]